MTRKPPLWLVVMVTLSGTMGMHMFLPALPEAGRELGTGSGPMQMTIGVYIVGLGIGQLVYGPLSDAWGRRRVLMAGLVLYCIGSAVAALAPDIVVLIVARILQSLGACAGVALGRAIVRDTNTDEGMVRDVGLLAMLMTLNPVLAPMVGGVVTAAFGWRANFIVLGLTGALTLTLVYLLLQETARPSGRFAIRGVLGDYRDLLKTRQYAAFAIGGGFVTTTPFPFLITAPFIFTRQLGESVQMAGVYSGIMLLGLAAGNGVAGALSRRLGSTRVLRTATALNLACCAAFLLMVLMHRLSVPSIMAVMLVLALGLGLANPPAIGKAMSIDPRLYGSASGLYGAIQMAAASILTGLVASGPEPALAAALAMLLSNLIALGCFRWGLRGERGPA
jgi:DHA1 family bicyclomycin/chloramphenicol resistance-like MFS transporter